MLEPSIDSLQEQIRSKYSLITLSARRARQLRDDFNEKGRPEEDAPTETFVSVALREIQKGELKLPEEYK